MKKFKSLLLFCIAAVLAFTIPLASACNTDNGADSETLNSISLNTDNAKLKFVGGQEFTSEGLVVTATFTSKGQTKTKDVTSDAVVDSSALNREESGDYEIVVSYTSGGVTKQAGYTINYTAEDREGLLVTFSDGSREKTFNLTGSSRTISIDTSDIVVNYVLYNEVQGEITDYDVIVSKEDKVITDYSNVGSGTYQIWVTRESSIKSGFILKDLVFIYVVEEVSNLAFAGGTQRQNIGIDEITSTWTYTVESSSGETIPLTAADVSVTIESLTAGSKTATASYTYYNAKGETKVLTVKVPYTIVQGANQQKDTDTSEITLAALGVSGSAAVPLNQDNFTGKNAFLTVCENRVVLNARPDNGEDVNLVEIRGDVLTVEFKGVGTLAITARSTANANLSSIGVKNANGEYMSGSADNTNATMLTYDEGVMFEVTGKSTEAATVTFIIPEAGVYTIFTNDNDPDGNNTYARNTRIYSIVKTDVYDTTSTASVFSNVGDINEIDLINEEI